MALILTFEKGPKGNSPMILSSSPCDRFGARSRRQERSQAARRTIRKVLPVRRGEPVRPGRCLGRRQREEGITVVFIILNLIETALTLYIFIIVGRFLMSWMPLRSGTLPYRIYSLLYDASEPYLRIFRPFLPLVRFGNAALDLSPLAGLAVLILAAMIVSAL